MRIESWRGRTIVVVWLISAAAFLLLLSVVDTESHTGAALVGVLSIVVAGIPFLITRRWLIGREASADPGGPGRGEADDEDRERADRDPSSGR